MIEPMKSLKDKIAEKAALEAELQAVESDVKREKKISKSKH